MSIEQNLAKIQTARYGKDVRQAIHDAIEEGYLLAKEAKEIALGHDYGHIYGFYINGAESDPEKAVTYLADAVGMTPAHMNFTTGVFDYGDWEDAFFMPRPCMLKSDGTVDYYLNPNDYTKKLNGSASDVANTSYDGNAMMEWGKEGKKIWLKIVPDSNPRSASIYIADYQVDDGFKDLAFHNANGDSVSHFYTPIYNGSVISSKMRSLSGQALSKTINTTTQRTYAQANNPSDSAVMWDIEVFVDRLLINFLLVLMAKSLNAQKAYGEGATVSGTEAINDTFLTGVHNTKGLFYGTNSGSVSANTFGNCVKVFGMENWWGMQWRRILGLVLASGVEKIKLTRNTEDGSTVTDYNQDGSGYVSTGVECSGTNGGYISEVKFTDKALLPKVASGTATTHFCDGLWFNASGERVALFGGGSSFSSKAGAFCCALGAAGSDAGWDFGAALSCKPLS